MGFPRYSLGEKESSRGSARCCTSLGTRDTPGYTFCTLQRTVGGSPCPLLQDGDPTAPWREVISQLLRPCDAKRPYAAFYEASGSTAQPLVPSQCHPSPLCLRHRAPTHGVPNPEQYGGRPGRAIASQAWRGREPAQPEGLGVCRARCVLCGPDGTYPGRVPTQRGAGRPARARGMSVRPAPRQSTPGAACTAPVLGALLYWSCGAVGTTIA